MGKSLVVVESPAKARTIGRYLGDDVRVMASMGHVRDLPRSSLGVDVAGGFKPVYVLTANGKKVSRELRKAAREADDIYLATDPDREGEAIAWHLIAMLKSEAKEVSFHRVSFHEITRNAIQASFENPGKISENRVSAQQARRVLDRLVGYQVSPMLWKDVRKGTSAGRVQSVALRLVVEREREIQAFEPDEYWNLDALFQTHDPAAELETRLALLDGKKPVIPNADSANALAAEIEAADYAVSNVASKPRKQRAKPPFITSTLQQSAGSAMRFSASQTMRVAQQLYEGIELGGGDSAGLITYMRTDSVSVSKEAQNQARAFIENTFGNEYVPAKPNRYRSGKGAQEAHEAIRPTDVSRTPKLVAAHLNKQQLKLYTLIWKRFVASQMAPARQLDHTIDIEAKGHHLTHAYIFRASARETLFPGYLRVYDVKENEDGEEGDGLERKLPKLTVGMPCSLLELTKDQCFTKPPPRYSEATLVKALEQNGVGRPSTYAATVNTIQEREYVQKQKGRLVPSDLGASVNDYLVDRMPDLFDVGFTAEMEAELDKVEAGETDWTAMLERFYEQFKKWVDVDEMPPIPSAADAKAFLDAFPDDIDWQEPRMRGRRMFDDKEFHASLKQQVEEKKKNLTERQWKALLTLAGRYADDYPQIVEAAAGLHAEKTVRELAQAHRDADDEPEKPDEMDLNMLAVLNKIDWDPPVQRGRRTYDDKKFYRSLKRQVEAGKKLSEAQVRALKRLMTKYAGQIADFDTVKETFGLEALEDKNGSAAADADPEAQQKIQALIDLADQIQEWAPPVKRGRRTYNDQEFIDSLKRQFENKRTLSDRQVAALKKVLGKYAAQIPDYETKVDQLGLPEEGGKAQEVDALCPQCGAKLVKRTSRRKGKTFYGCSAFPKCRFLCNELPPPAAQEQKE